MPEWLPAAIEALVAFRARHGRDPEIAALSEVAMRHVLSAVDERGRPIGDGRSLLGIPTCVDPAIDGVEFR